MVRKDGLWHKMRQYGVEEKFVRVYVVHYNRVRARIESERGQSRWFGVERCEGLHNGVEARIMSERGQSKCFGVERYEGLHNGVEARIVSGGGQLR